ncbi:unnamed protein product [Dicrocoelium dendriticum]|nr:unnamed protein product [Dicrocoelium dendriticum]
MFTDSFDSSLFNMKYLSSRDKTWYGPSWGGVNSLRTASTRIKTNKHLCISGWICCLRVRPRRRWSKGSKMVLKTFSVREGV